MPPTPIIMFEYEMQNGITGETLGTIEAQGNIELGDLLNLNGTLLKVTSVYTREPIIRVDEVGHLATVRLKGARQ